MKILNTLEKKMHAIHLQLHDIKKNSFLLLSNTTSLLDAVMCCQKQVKAD